MPMKPQANQDCPKREKKTTGEEKSGGIQLRENRRNTFCEGRKGATLQKKKKRGPTAVQ